MPSNALRLVLLPVIFLAIQLDVLAWAGADDEICALVTKLKDERDDVAQVAVEALTKAGFPTIGPLTEYLARERSCFGRLNALLVLIEVDRQNPSVVPSLKKIVVNPCSISPWKDIAQRRDAALLMGNSGRGIRELAGLLKGYRRFVRRSAIWVFDEVAETIDHATPDVVVAVRESLPAIATATKDGDRIVREVAWEVLDELSAARQSAVCREARSLRGSLGGSLLPQDGPDGCEAGYLAFERGDYETALPELQFLAEKGQARAMYHLSEMYFAGQGVLKSMEQGQKWLVLAAEQRYPEAQARLGRAALTAQDCTTAFKWVTAAARQGFPAAQFQLGTMYDRGQCIWQDSRSAAEWYSRAAENKMPEALYNLGVLFEQGHGVQQDYSKAINLYFAAAQEGYYPGIFKMGLMFLRGRGVQKDNVRALAWFFRSDVITPPRTPQAEFIERHARAMVTAVVGQPEDPDEAGRLVEKMKPDEIRRAQRLAAIPWKGLPQPPR